MAVAAEGAAHGGEVDGGDEMIGMDVDAISGEGNEGNKMSFGGNRWPRQETLALLKIRSDMDAVFRDSTLKGPLWEEVSRYIKLYIYIYIINIFYITQFQYILSLYSSLSFFAFSSHFILSFIDFQETKKFNTSLRSCMQIYELVFSCQFNQLNIPFIPKICMF